MSRLSRSVSLHYHTSLELITAIFTCAFFTAGNALIGLIHERDFLKITILDFIKLSASMNFGTRMMLQVWGQKVKGQGHKGPVGGGIQSSTLCVEF